MKIWKVLIIILSALLVLWVGGWILLVQINKPDEWISDQYKILSVVDNENGIYLVQRISGFQDKILFLELYKTNDNWQTDFSKLDSFVSIIPDDLYQYDEASGNMRFVRYIQNVQVNLQSEEFTIYYDDGHVEKKPFY